MHERHPTADLTRLLLGIVSISLLIIGSLWVIKPFLPAFIWATMIVVATWPIMIAVEHRLGGRRSLAVLVMVIGMTIVIILPFAAAISTISSNAASVATLARNLPHYHPPAPPAWVQNLPLVGDRIQEEWKSYSDTGTDGLAERMQPYLSKIADWALGKAGSVGMLFVHLLLTLLISAIFYSRGEEGVAALNRLAWRLGGPSGESSIKLAGQSIRAVAMGIVVTALVQSILGGMGLWVAGVPFAGMLSALMILFCIAQLGPTLPLLGGVAWLYFHGSETWGSILLVWTVLVAMIESFLRPVLIRRGADLPILLILVGVLGGMLSFGIIGLFVGPVILAVTYTLMQAWIAEGNPAPIEAAGDQKKAADIGH